MKALTSQVIRSALRADETVRHDQYDAVLSMLTERAPRYWSYAAKPLLVTQAEAARILSVSTVTLYRMVKEGKLKPVMIRGARRYRWEDLERIAKGEDAVDVGIEG
jgi:excisionase family DNA binding protein